MNNKQYPEGMQSDICSHLDLLAFKTQPCKLIMPHQHHKCLFYHDIRSDRRRVPITYTAEYCPNIAKLRQCDYGENCTFSHNKAEETYHPTKYKSKYCSQYPNGLQNCNYGEFCCFAHNEYELTIDLLHKFIKDNDFYMFHFKTAWCPFAESHPIEECVYAHNWQDYRRKPHCYYYTPKQCPLWNNSKLITTYLEGCPNGMLCPNAHGWKEAEYHPSLFQKIRNMHDYDNTKVHYANGVKSYYKSTNCKNGFVMTPKNRINGNLSQMNQSFVNSTMKVSPPLFGINVFNIIPIHLSQHFDNDMGNNPYNFYQPNYFSEYKWAPMHRMSINYNSTYTQDQPLEDNYFVVQNPLLFNEDSEELRFKAFLRLHNLFHLYSILRQNGITELTFQSTSDITIDKYQIGDKDKAALKLAIHQLNKSNQLAMNSIKDFCL